MVCNHLSLADPPLLAYSIDRKMIFMAKEELFRYGPLTYFIKNFGAFPVRRGKMNLEAFRRAEEVLAQHLALAIFPEGMRSRSGALKEALPGVALLAKRSGAPVLPVGISGSERIKGLTWLMRRPAVNINIGQIFYPKLTPDRIERNPLRGATSDIMEHIAELLPAAYRGIYAKGVTGWH